MKSCFSTISEGQSRDFRDLPITVAQLGVWVSIRVKAGASTASLSKWAVQFIQGGLFRWIRPCWSFMNQFAIGHSAYELSWFDVATTSISKIRLWTDLQKESCCKIRLITARLIDYICWSSTAGDIHIDRRSDDNFRTSTKICQLTSVHHQICQQHWNSLLVQYDWADIPIHLPCAAHLIRSRESALRIEACALAWITRNPWERWAACEIQNNTGNLLFGRMPPPHLLHPDFGQWYMNPSCHM